MSTSTLPRLSIVLPFRNMAATLAAAVESVWSAAPGLAVEIHAIDDGSTDGAPGLAAELLARGRIHRLIRHADSRGPAAARNAGLAAASGEFVGFLDADDLRLPGTFVDQIAFLEREPETAGVLDGVCLEPLGSIDPGPVRAILQLGALLVRRAVFDPANVGGFNESMRYGEDADWMMRAQEKGLRIARRECPAVRYRRHAGSLMADREGARAGLAVALRHALLRRRDEHACRESAPAAHLDS